MVSNGGRPVPQESTPDHGSPEHAVAWTPGDPHGGMPPSGYADSPERSGQQPEAPGYLILGIGP